MKLLDCCHYNSERILIIKQIENENSYLSQLRDTRLLKLMNNQIKIYCYEIH